MSTTEKNWYPKNLAIKKNVIPKTLSFLKTIYMKEQHFTYAEFGIYKAATPQNICENFPNAILHLFDYEDAIENAKIVLQDFPNKVYYYPNSTKYHDSYNWNLGILCTEGRGNPIFDYCFLDGAHTFAVDALTFFLCDKLTRSSGFLDFDDYNWTLRGSSLDPLKVPIINDLYTYEQIDSKQVKFIVDALVKTDKRYREVVADRLYQKMG